MDEENQKRNCIRLADLLIGVWNQGFCVQNVVYSTVPI